jgi:transcriptional regulator
MYMPRHFAENRPEVLQALMAEHPLATLVWQDASGPQAEHIPLRYVANPDPELPGVLRGHVARANPLWWTHDATQWVLAIFQGPQAYISPSLYPSKQEHGRVVPTWNYAVVHARGQLAVHEDPAWLHALVTELTDHHEAERAQPWAVNDAPAEYIEGLTRAIVGIEIAVQRLEGKWKVSQNRPPADRAGVVRGLAAATDPAARAMAALVGDHDPDAV